MATLSIVIPAYNEESGIRDIIQRVLKVKRELADLGVYDLDLIVVDDGSRDQTVEIVGSVEGVRLIRHHVNRGYGAALKTGFAHAEGEFIGFLDADGTYPPEYFPQLCRAAINGSDLVIGSRMAGTESSMPLTRRIGNLFFAGLLTLVSRQRVSDSASGMRVFKKEILERIYPLPDGLNLTPVMSTRAIHEGISMAEIPIPYSERVGRSKLSVIHDGRVFLQSIIWTVMMYNPVRVLGMLGLGGVSIAVLMGIGIVIARLSGIRFLGPWGVAALYVGMISGVVGISLFALGTTFNYLVSLFYNQPIRQGLFGKPVFKVPLDQQFGWIGVLSIITGVIIGFASLLLGLNGWDISRLWLYLFGSAMIILIGVQLVIFWLLMRILDELNQRDINVQRDLSVY